MKGFPFKRRLFSKAVCALSLGVFLAIPTNPTVAQNAEPLGIGFLMPLTGGSGKLGQMMIEGSNLAVDEINASGGVAGRPIKLIAQDSQALARQGVDGYRKLVDVDGVKAIITGWTTVVSAIAPLAEREKIFLLSASTASPALRGVSSYFQSTWMFDDETVRLILPYAHKHMNVRRLALFTVISDLGVGLSKSIKDEWKKLGGELVAEESHQQQETNFRPSMLKMLRAQPDAIYLTSANGAQSAQIIRQARELGYKGFFFSFGAIEDPEIIALGERAEGLYYTAPSFHPDSEDKAMRAFTEKFKARYGRAPNVHQANHYDLIYMLKQAAEGLQRERKPFTGENVHAYFRKNFQQYHGAGGGYKLNYSDGSTLRSTVVKTVKGGAFVRVAELD